MTIRFFSCAILTTLAACSIPQEHCISQINQEILTVNRLAQSLEANISRGYAIELYQDVETFEDRCIGRDSTGARFKFECEKTNVIDKQRAVAIDVATEKTKLNSLRARLDQLKKGYDQSVAQCKIRYPSETYSQTTLN